MALVLLKERSTLWRVGGSNPNQNWDLRPYIRIYYEQTAQDKALLRTRVVTNYYMQFYSKTSGYMSGYDEGSYSNYIDNSNKGWVSYVKNLSYTVGYSLFFVGQTSSYIYHNQATGKASFNYHLYNQYEGDIYSTGVSGTLSVPTIQVSFAVSISNFDLEQSPVITVGVTNTSYNYELRYSIGSLSGTIASNQTTSTYIWEMDETLKNAIREEMATTKTKTLTITCETYDGEMSKGTKTATCTLTINEQPTIQPTPLILELNSDVYSYNNPAEYVIKNLSSLKFTINATAPYATTISIYSVRANSEKIATSNSNEVVINDISTHIIDNEEKKVNFYVSVTDARGNTSEETLVTLLFIDYIKSDYINTECIVKRAEDFDYLDIVLKGNFFDGNIGTTTNELDEEDKINPAQDYDMIQTLTFAAASGTCNIRLYRGSSSAYTGTVKVREGTSGPWSDLSVSGTTTTFNVTNTTMQIAHDWNKSGNDYMTCSFYGQSTNLTGIAISQKAILSGVIGGFFMYNYAFGCTNLTSLDVPDTSSITTVGGNFMTQYAGNCNALTTLILPSVGWFATHDVSWSVPSGRLTYLKGQVLDSSDLSGWQALTTSTSPNTLYLNYIQNTTDVYSDNIQTTTANELILGYKYKEKGSTGDYTTGTTTLTPTIIDNVFTVSTTLEEIFDHTKSFEIVFTINDKIYTGEEMTKNVATSEYIMLEHENGVDFKDIFVKGKKVEVNKTLAYKRLTENALTIDFNTNMSDGVYRLVALINTINNTGISMKFNDITPSGSCIALNTVNRTDTTDTVLTTTNNSYINTSFPRIGVAINGYFAMIDVNFIKLGTNIRYQAESSIVSSGRQRYNKYIGEINAGADEITKMSLFTEVSQFGLGSVAYLFKMSDDI